MIFQVVWIRELRLVFGATTSASAAVLAIFMAGLGLGNALLGKRMDESQRPLRWYARFELGIAIFTASTPFLIDLARWFYVSIGGQVALGPTLATFVRLLIAAAVLAVPTVLMGGTLPAAARAVVSNSDPTRRGIAALYGLNTLGAVLGAFLANFWLIEQLGNRGVLWLACGVNAFIALAAFSYSRQLCAQSPVKTKKHLQVQPAPSEVGNASSLVFVCATSAVVGCAFFLMELVWYRMLGPLLGGTTYTFGLILCVALLGIGAGGATYNLVGRWLKPSLQLVSLTCALEALLIAIPFWYGDQIALWMQHAQSVESANFAAVVWNWFQVGAFVILPAAAVSGFQFPLLIAVAGSGRENVGKHVGWTFASNTAGAICGSLAGGFLLLPALTAPGLWMAAILGLAAWGIVLAVVSLRGTKHLRDSRTLGLAACCAGLAILATYADGPTPAWRHSGIGAGRGKIVGTSRNSDQEFLHAQRRKCVWETDGLESSVGIIATDSLSFNVNGKSDGNAYADAGTQIGLGLLGPILHPKPQTGLVIGLGTAETAGWLADAGGMQQVDVIELEPAVQYMAELCAPLNRNALQNPKIQLHYNDAREFLLTSSQAYDIIISEPSNPYRAGIANLYTQEFYRSAHERLSEDGLFLQWLQGYEVDDRTVQIVLRTLRTVFPEVQVWRTIALDMVLVCGKSPQSLQHTQASLTRWQADPVIREGLQLAWRIDDLEGLLAHYVCGSKAIEQFCSREEAVLNRDDRNLLEYAFAKTMGQLTRFSVVDLQAQAIQLRDDSPLPPGEWNEQRLAQRRLALHAYLGGTVPSKPWLLTGQTDRADAFTFYTQFNYSAAAQAFQKFPLDDSCAIERVLYAHSLAEAGQPIPEKVLAAIQADNKTEASAIAAIGFLKKGDRRRGLEESLAMLRQLHQNPWGSPQLLTAALRHTIPLTEVDAAAATQVLAQLDTPFSMHRLEEDRLLGRCLVAMCISPDQSLTALAAIEPNVFWKAGFLTNRAQLYTATGHWRAGRARADASQFDAWARQPR
ncbi:fused MFS/spermidine synthase [Anatilimnocola aggregata]|uniref:fused MFS/spermidine synthase n=1 Tax=Anatilimnocola aggregata TaxID=2528021 RepID=UPI00192E572D|nr:fused MFS/spermidine synthase [Anatilimnocola aggregata]